MPELAGEDTNITRCAENVARSCLPPSRFAEDHVVP